MMRPREVGKVDILARLKRSAAAASVSRSLQLYGGVRCAKPQHST
jgi:hypothetical protein